MGVGILAALRSLKFGGATTGVVITASHNPPEDNGVKIVDPSGGMLAEDWELYATELSQPSTKKEFKIALESILTKAGVDINKNTPHVITATDTRESSPELYKALLCGLNALKTEHKHYGVQTTPFLHYLVMMSNMNNGSSVSLNTLSEGLYYKQFSEAYLRLLSTACKQMPEGDNLNIDCANGVGAILARKISSYIPQNILDITVFNNKIDDHQSLNNQCGADFVKTTFQPPTNSCDIKPGKSCSFDGDADRVVFWYLEEDKTLQLLDGDRISILMAEFLLEHIKKSKLENVNIGIVQTAYSNRSSTDYITKTLNIPVVLSCTGVKNLHHAAVKMDVGIYFESNGHGTVIFSRRFLEAINNAKSSNEQEKASIQTLKAFYKLLNQATGDAMSDALAVCAILSINKWSLKKWKSLYTDIPHLLQKIQVNDKSMFETCSFDTVLTKPIELKGFIDKQVLETPGGRCFVRPSGTENVIRVYAEADTEHGVANLMENVCNFLKENFGSK